ncbi:alpha-(1,3)-fucosyltransferase C-like [Vanessa cardui]|uniref:alpha-(1,3)-fucosyltransferase C-like n=1 Tax=Vanessa cardui TaxID=171605 RepID=UPI001F12A988|nr:alpha-(1,3)-fucosyltransferase C-like [Vanessa cardui]
MKNNIFTKVVTYCFVTAILLFLYKLFIDLKYTNDTPRVEIVIENREKVEIVTESDTKSKLKYILQWTSPKNVPFVYMGQGRQGFIDRNCSFTNCFVTPNESYLGDYTKFDVIAFAGPEVRFMTRQGFFDRLPKRRSPHQKYVFASIESAENYPVCTDTFDGFFNWTWTYKLDSDAKWGYIVIRDSTHKIVGPKKNMHWMKLEDMDPVSENLRKILSQKTRAAAWFISNCYSRSGREIFVQRLQKRLEKYALDVDIYGECGSMTCPRDRDDECNKLIERDYYFYLSFENSFAEDYVTEKLLHPLKNNAVPIVYGGANYTRFMPDGIYLNARELGPEKLALKMNEIIKDPEMYAGFFKWKNHYSYYGRHESIETNDYCRFCSMLNEEDLVNTTSVYEKFRSWWDPPHRC